MALRRVYYFVSSLLFCFMLVSISILVVAGVSDDKDVQEFMKNRLRNEYELVKTIKKRIDTNAPMAELIVDPSINKKIREDIKRIRQNIRRIILRTLVNIEGHRDFKIVLEHNKLLIKPIKKYDPFPENLQIDILTSSIKEQNISVKTLKFATEALKNVANDLYEKAQTASYGKFGLYYDYTSFTYELCDIVVEILTDIRPTAEKEIRTLHRERVTELTTMKIELQKEKETLVDPHDVLYFNGLILLVDAALNKWNTLILAVDNQIKWSNQVENIIQAYEQTKKKAAYQLEVLEKTQVTNELEKYLSKYDISDFPKPPPLLPLESKTIKLLMIKDPKQYNND